MFTADGLFGATRWRAHDFYRQYLQPLDLRFILGANLRGARRLPFVRPPMLYVIRCD